MSKEKKMNMKLLRAWSQDKINKANKIRNKLIRYYALRNTQ